MALEITPKLSIDEDELTFTFVRSSGPGGQNVNKVSTAVQLRFDLMHSPSLPLAIRQRAAKLAGRRLTEDGILVLTSRQHRTQSQNRARVISQLIDLLRAAAKPPKPRRKTKPTAASRERRLAKKQRRSEIKRNRRPVKGDDE
ncbi:aminoacyl-tRNA hydrolase [Chloroflexi bacterium TSY]|nr:aminoacyl-tRNA hydrolase [Chloroflexi bacterium TSY]